MDYITVKRLKQMIKNHGDDWVFLIDGHPIDQDEVETLFGYPGDYGIWDDDEGDDDAE